MSESASPEELARDVLAADEFEIPAPDPVLHERSGEAHDVLAADEFALGGPDPALAEHLFVPPADPSDPTGAEAPHDVLAAEEFAVPAAQTVARTPLRSRSPLGPIALALALALLAGALLRRRRA